MKLRWVSGSITLWTGGTFGSLACIRHPSPVIRHLTNAIFHLHRWLFGLIGLACFPSGVLADNPAITLVTADGWTLRSAVQGQSVVGFLASRSPSSVPAHTLSTVWFKRQADGQFSWHGWTGESYIVAGKHSATLENDPDLFAHFEIKDNGNLSSLDESSTFVSMNKGLAADDFFQPLIDVLSPTQVETIVQVVAKGAIGLSASEKVTVTRCPPNGTEPVQPSSGPDSNSELQADLQLHAAFVESFVA